MTLDNLISESGRRTGIGQAAEPLTRELLQLMTGGPGGLSGFLDRFRSAGLGTEVASFLGGRDDTPLPPKAVDNVIGETTVASMARRAGVAVTAASSAIGFEIPKLIGMLTPGGAVPAVLPSEIQTFVNRHEPVTPIPAAAVRERRNPIWLWALLALAVLALIVWMLLARNRPVPAPTPQVATPAVSTPTIPAPAPPAVTGMVASLNQELNGTVLNFATDSAVLPAASEPDLRRAADQIKGLPAGTVIEIGGHTDNTGNADANIALSQQRADAVRDALMRDGVDSSRLTAKGYGDAQPIASNDTADGRLRNRRTEFTLANGGGSQAQTATTAPAAPVAQ